MREFFAERPVRVGERGGPLNVCGVHFLCFVFQGESARFFASFRYSRSEILRSRHAEIPSWSQDNRPRMVSSGKDGAGLPSPYCVLHPSSHSRISATEKLEQLAPLMSVILSVRLMNFTDVARAIYEYLTLPKVYRFAAMCAGYIESLVLIRGNGTGRTRRCWTIRLQWCVSVFRYHKVVSFGVVFSASDAIVGTFGGKQFFFAHSIAALS
jgi:hypothetical protein